MNFSRVPNHQFADQLRAARRLIAFSPARHLFSTPYNLVFLSVDVTQEAAGL